MGKRCTAVACIRGDAGHSGLRGTVKLFPCAGGTLVVADICGLPESETGFFAMHIHEGGNCGRNGFPNTGSHYNPEGKMHPKHAGDIPPLLSCRGKAYLTVLTDRFRWQDVVGRTVVIHSHVDDFYTQPAGNAGTKIACGVIRRVQGIQEQKCPREHRLLR